MKSGELGTQFFLWGRKFIFGIMVQTPQRSEQLTYFAAEDFTKKT